MRQKLSATFLNQSKVCAASESALETAILNAVVLMLVAVSSTKAYDKRLQELDYDDLPLNADSSSDALLVVEDEGLCGVELRRVALGHEYSDALVLVEGLVDFAVVDGGAVEVEDDVVELVVVLAA